jgi:hypothetical protein
MMPRRTGTGPHTRQEHTVKDTPPHADQMLDLAAGPGIVPKVVYGTLDRSRVRKFCPPLEGHQWPAALGGLALPIGPSEASKPLAMYGVCYAGRNFSSSASAPRESPTEGAR